MSLRIVSNGLDPLTKPSIDYLALKYGIPAKDVQRVQLDSEVGQAQILTVTLLVDTSVDADLTAGEGS